MSNGDDEPDAGNGEGSGEADQASAEKAGAAESELGSGEDNPTAKEIAADEDTGSDAEADEDEPAGEADEEARLEADQMEAERADEESTSGDDAEIDAPDEPAEERDETEDDGTEDEEVENGQESETESDEAADDAADDAETGDGTSNASETDEAPEEGSGDEDADEAAAEEGSSEDTDEADATEEESPADGEAETDESDAEEDGKPEDTETGDETSDDGEPEEDGEADDGDGDDESEADAIETKHTPESLDERLDDIENRIEEADTEADLDAVETDLDDVEADIEAADLPEPDEDEDEDGDDEDDERTRGELESRVTELRETIEAQRGPYAEDAVETVEGAKTTIAETRWTDQGEREVADAVEDFLDEAGDVLDEEFAVERSDDTSVGDEVATDGGEDQDDTADEHGALVAALDDVIETIDARDLDPDENEETVAGLVEAAEGLTNDLDDAQEWDDLTVREKLAAEGFYDVLESENRKDFPPEWNAIKIYEKRHEPEPILRGLEMFGSDFMEEHCIESLKRLGAPAAFDAMEQRAQKRDKPPIEALGKIGDDRAVDTLHEYIEGESDPGLQKVTLKALGEIGSEESTQPVADRLVADNETVRSNAARALGLIGDARAIDPLADVLAEDDSNSVRASAAWALNQIGTESALDAAREHADDRSYLVQTEAEKAEHAMTDDGDATETPV